MYSNRLKNWNILFWCIVGCLIFSYFVLKGNDWVQCFYFITCLIPVTIGTSTIFNQYLLPRYLMQEKFRLFALYTIYLIIISLNAELLIVFCSIIVFNTFQVAKYNLLTVDVLSLAMMTYLVVIIRAFIEIFLIFRKKQSEIEAIQKEVKKQGLARILINADRKKVQVALDGLVYIESLGDQIKVVTNEAEYLTREKISHIADRLPSHFMRIHRSFLVNKNFVQSFNKDRMLIQGIELPISRTYKKTVSEKLNV